MAVIPMKALLESGVHFGHRTNKWDPRMKPYIFTERNGIHIIDLQQTSKLLSHAYNVVRDAVANGGMVLFVGTKRQAQETVAEEAARCGMPYVTERWMGGMLTNWSTMHARIEELERLEKMRDNNELDRLTKKEGLLIGREITRLTTRLSGTRSMKRRPDLLFIIDVGREEADCLGVLDDAAQLEHLLPGDLRIGDLVQEHGDRIDPDATRVQRFDPLAHHEEMAFDHDLGLRDEHDLDHAARDLLVDRPADAACRGT